MRFQVLDSNKHLVSDSKTLAGAKRSANAFSKRERNTDFFVFDAMIGKIVTRYQNGSEHFL